MSDEAPSVANEEWLARFIISSRWVREDHTVRQDAFIPHPHLDLSVTRHRDLSTDQLWRVGQAIADARPATLYGRADVAAEQVRRQKLQVEARPVPENLNRALLVGRPTNLLKKVSRKN